MIPNILHFIFLGGQHFFFAQFMAIFSAQIVNKPDVIYFHCDKVPYGEWWDKTKDMVTVNIVEPPKDIEGKAVTSILHQVDCLRLSVLEEYGGIYFDIDTISLNNYKSLLKNEFVLVEESPGVMSNAIIFADKDSSFLERWHDEFRKRYDPSVQGRIKGKIPYDLSKRFPEEVTIVPNSYFNPAKFLDEDSVKIFNDTGIIGSELLTLHYFNHTNWDHYVMRITPKWVQIMQKNTYSQIVANLNQTYNEQFEEREVFTHSHYLATLGIVCIVFVVVCLVLILLGRPYFKVLHAKYMKKVTGFEEVSEEPTAIEMN